MERDPRKLRFDALAKDAYEAGALKAGLDQVPLWPAPYHEDTPEALWRFVTECCWTYNEADRAIELIPDHEYLQWLVHHWWNSRATGQELIIQKSRRMVVSWVIRACELWSLGMRRERGVVAGLNYPKAAEHVWRHAFMLRELKRRNPKIKIDHEERGGNFGTGQLDQVLLPNGSLVETLNQEGESFQGSGYSWVCLEEFCLYRRVAYMRAQAKFVTQGAPGKPGGFVVSISNASPNKEWLEAKA